MAGPLDPARPTLAELAEEHDAVSAGNADRNPPLNAVVEQQWANDLGEDERNQEIGHALSRARHYRPATFQRAVFLTALISPASCVLDDSKSSANETADN